MYVRPKQLVRDGSRFDCRTIVSLTTVGALKLFADSLSNPLRAAVAIFELFVDLISQVFRHGDSDVFSVFHNHTTGLWRNKYMGTYSVWLRGNEVMYRLIACTTVVKWYLIVGGTVA